MTMETVRIFDPDTQRITKIPAGELASGMIRAQVSGIDGEVWIEASKVKDGLIRHGPFDEETREIFRHFAVTLADVYARTVEEWEAGFRWDANPEKEIALWLIMEDAFLHFTEGRTLGKEQKKDIFNVILACVNNGPQYVLKTTSARTLSPKRKQAIIEYMQNPGK